MLDLKGGDSNPYPKKKYTQKKNTPACDQSCYNAGGHDFMCTDPTDTYAFGTMGNEFSGTFYMKCTPLQRYNDPIIPCSGVDTGFVSDCDGPYDKPIDP